MKVVYIAHPLADDPARNRENAARWCAWAALVKSVSPVADWVVLSSVLDESYRELGLRCDCALIGRCDEVWLVGGRVSAGMQVEADAARLAGIPVVDLTHMGYEAPCVVCGALKHENCDAGLHG